MYKLTASSRAIDSSNPRMLAADQTYLKLQAGCGCISIVAGDFPKQRSHTRTGASPQPRSGTGLLLVEHASQTPPPQERQWCLVSPSANTWRHSWHAYGRKDTRIVNLGKKAEGTLVCDVNKLCDFAQSQKLEPLCMQNSINSTTGEYFS